MNGIRKDTLCPLMFNTFRPNALLMDILCYCNCTEPVEQDSFRKVLLTEHDNGRYVLVFGSIEKSTVINTEERVRFQINYCGICGGQSGAVAGFSASTSVPVVSIIPPTLHAHAHIYRQHHIFRIMNKSVTENS